MKEPHMARTTRPLTNTEVLKAKAREKDFTLHDGDGLFLIVKTSGKSCGASVINDRNSSELIGLGSYPALRWQQPKLRASISLLARGIDPQTASRASSRTATDRARQHFLNVAANWFHEKQQRYTRLCEDIWRSLEKDIFPAIGEIPFRK
jgi:hypothetical protein